MPNVDQLVYYMYGFVAVIAVIGLVGVLKLLDWLISQKYVSIKQCEKCRGDIYKTAAIDHDLLRELNAKMDIILESFNLNKKK